VKSYNEAPQYFYSYHDNKVYISFCEMNRLIVFDANTGAKELINLPETGNKFSWYYYYDHSQKKSYMAKLYKKKSDLYSFDLSSRKLTYVGSLDYHPVAMLNGKVVIRDSNKDIYKYHLIDIQNLDADSPTVNLKEIIVK